MSKMHFNRILIVGVLIVVCFGWSIGQGRKGSNTRSQGTDRTEPQQRRELPSVDKDWWAAQRSIEAAIQELEAYLRKFPDGGRSETARQQIAVLRDLTITAALPEWATMDHEVPSRDVPDWRISSLRRLADRATVTIEIRCKRQDGEDCHFLSFERHPLVLLDSAGRFYSMLEASSLPPETRYTDTGKAILAAGRILPVVVNFARLEPGAVSGQVQYRDRNTADPAPFSALPTH
jgi:hypothetical protein